MWVASCDPGVDDAVALAVAAGLAGFGPAAVVAVAGNVPAAVAWRNAAGLVDLLGLGIPVGLDAEDTLDGRPIRRAGSPHGADGLGGLAGRLPLPPGAPRDGRPLVRGDVVATGPLTSVARALRSGNPVERVVWTGGSTAVAAGDQGAPREFNAAADPQAVREVSKAGIGLAVVPIEVTSHVTFSAEDVTAWRSGPPVARLCADLVDRRVRSGPGIAATRLHDPLAVLAAAEPGLFRWEEHTVACRRDGSLVPDPRGGPTRIAVAVHAAEARRRVVDAVAGDLPWGPARTGAP